MSPLESGIDITVSREFPASIHSYGLYQCSVQSRSCTSVVAEEFQSQSKIGIITEGVVKGRLTYFDV